MTPNGMLITSKCEISQKFGVQIKNDIENIEYRDAIKLYRYIKEHISDKGMYYVFLDEIQMLNSNFVDLINGLMHIENLDIYVTGSNSKFLSSDILTEFRGRGDEVRVFPISI